jgi:hypothetical protein
MNATQTFTKEIEKTVLYPASWPQHEHFNNFGGEVGQDSSDHFSELEDKKVKQIQNYSDIEQLVTFLKELQKGEVDPKMKEQDLSPGFFRNCVIRASAIIIRQIQNNLEPPHEVVTGILDLFQHYFAKQKFRPKEREYATDLGFMFLDDAASYSIEKLGPRPYARLLWDRAMACFMVHDSELLDADFHYRLCLGKWALIPRDPLETDIMLASARRCLTKFAFDMSDRAKEDE